MRRVGCLLGPLVVASLFARTGTIALAPIAFWVIAADAHPTACTCAHGTEAACPMHHKATPGLKVCVMRTLADSPTVLLSSLLGLAGLMPSATDAIVQLSSETAATVALSMATERAVTPDPPPPRS